VDTLECGFQCEQIQESVVLHEDVMMIQSKSRLKEDILELLLILHLLFLESVLCL